ncbi:hypothetical protein IC235_01115 [Hymenobacter sp. BT664]|uniref:Uncharacterized protein n=1 Tax=Hymenobacter montanus TaxID=2771359 RepID=A0A927BAD9_9BACT|nr:hypothetical protein [Hymenobacter montanus]MBD2766488.1 hypothetical protein [Hymenobacter montanus]
MMSLHQGKSRFQQYLGIAEAALLSRPGGPAAKPSERVADGGKTWSRLAHSE